MCLKYPKLPCDCDLLKTFRRGASPQTHNIRSLSSLVQVSPYNLFNSDATGFYCMYTVNQHNCI